jgi:hypothetical protein
LEAAKQVCGDWMAPQTCRYPFLPPLVGAPGILGGFGIFSVFGIAISE